MLMCKEIQAEHILLIGFQSMAKWS